VHPGLVILTGAGVSADSGLATFRGAGGLWEGQPVEEVATPAAWRRDPARVWRFYQERRGLLGKVEPNAAHRALAGLAERLALARVPCLLVTQNVDDLHERAGSEPVHMHGELAVLRCEACGAAGRDLEHLDPQALVPCRACGFERLRPDVVWFGELPHHLPVIDAALARCTHFAAIGTSGSVYPAAGFLAAARAAGARTFVQSLERPENLSAGDEFAGGRAAQAVPDLCIRLLELLT
jgi:NAD-dependent deacetylase